MKLLKGRTTDPSRRASLPNPKPKPLDSPFQQYKHRVLILGDFNYDSFDHITRALHSAPEDTVIMIPRTKNKKNFPGATAIAQWIAREEGYPVFEHDLVYSKQEGGFSSYAIESLIRIFQPTKILNFGSTSPLSKDVKQWKELCNELRSAGAPSNELPPRPGAAYETLVKTFLASAKKNNVPVHYINSNTSSGRSSRTVVPTDFISEALMNGAPLEEVLYAS